MADITLNLDLRKKRITVRISELKLNLERFDLRKAEIADELVKIEENIQATIKAILDLEKELLS